MTRWLTDNPVWTDGSAACGEENQTAIRLTRDQALRARFDPSEDDRGLRETMEEMGDQWARRLGYAASGLRLRAQ